MQVTVYLTVTLTTLTFQLYISIQEKVTIRRDSKSRKKAPIFPELTPQMRMSISCVCSREHVAVITSACLTVLVSYFQTQPLKEFVNPKMVALVEGHAAAKVEVAVINDGHNDLFYISYNVREVQGFTFRG